MALMPWQTGRLLLLLLCSCLLTTCATATASSVRPAPQRWILLGEQEGIDQIVALVAGPSHRGDDAPRVTDLSARGVGIEAVVQQLAALPEKPPDRFILRLGETDAAGSLLSVERYRELVGALLVTLRNRAPVTVTTIPERPPAAEAGDTLSLARRLRRTAEYNETILAAAALYGATVAEVESTPEAASVWPSGARLDAMRARADRGAGAGLQPDAVAKVGDSITASHAFLGGLTEAGLHDAGYRALTETLPLSDGAWRLPGGSAGTSAFARESLAAGAGWSVADAIEGGEESPLAREIAALRPAVAVVMFGTNDLTHVPLASFEERLDRLLAELDRRGVVALLSTIPERRDSREFGARVPSFNRAIRALALAHNLPLVDYHAAMATLPDAGLSADGIHPSVCPRGPAVLSADCLRYGYNLRNLLTLEALHRLHGELHGQSVDLGADPISGR